MPEELLSELKNGVLDITWDDPDEDRKLIGILTRAKYKINKYAGAEIDYNTDLNAKQLMFDLCRYMYNNASEDFEKNYNSELLMLRAGYAVSATDEEEI